MDHGDDKATRKKIRELTGIAHERELAAALQKLQEHFADWQAGKIDAFALNDRIHHFHQQSSREIWKMYVHAGHNSMLVARALALGLLTEEEVGQKLVGQLGPAIDYWQDDRSD